MVAIGGTYDTRNADNLDATKLHDFHSMLVHLWRIPDGKGAARHIIETVYSTMMYMYMYTYKWCSAGTTNLHLLTSSQILSSGRGPF